MHTQVIHSARANATHNHGLDPDRLVVGKMIFHHAHKYFSTQNKNQAIKGDFFVYLQLKPMLARGLTKKESHIMPKAGLV